MEPGPVRLHPPTLCCPVICVPQAALSGNGIPMDLWLLNTLMGLLSTKNLTFEPNFELEAD
ncbi:UNVERIFIED_CONTAM: hypothetical protein Sangu_0978300 [Sesamum angustifolium]|uniref:Uncharacterized protein n=1 Tax=Sesamum angustifolium TaxID=2727405 RepID=A0AAW2PCI2_9LAMI